VAKLVGKVAPSIWDSTLGFTKATYKEGLSLGLKTAELTGLA